MPLNQHEQKLRYFFEIALNKSYEEMLEVAKYFDYLEIQPLVDFIHLEENMDNALENIKETIIRIIKAGQELNIPVVATGDVHHLLKSDKKFRAIYTQTPLVGGGLHPLSRFDDIPSQYFRTTKEMLEEFEFRSPNEIDVLPEYDLVMAKKLHMWGNGL